LESIRRWGFVFLMGALAPACLGSDPPNNKPPATLPADPTGLTVTPVTSGRIDLVWVDNSNNEHEFRIERSDDLGVNYTQIDIAPMNAQGYSDFGLLPNTTYYYRVRAWNGKGFSGYAGPSNDTTKTLAWSPKITGGPGTPLANHSAIFDALGNRMIVFGGFDDLFNPYNDVWSLDLSSASVTSGSWNLETTGGVTAPFRGGHTAIYDSANRRMIVFGGQNPLLEYQNDVYVLKLSDLTWSSPTVQGTPPAKRGYHTAVYDPALQRMVVYAGTNGGTFDLDDVYVLSLPATGPLVWSSPAVGARPVHRSQHSAIYDSIGDRMLIFGGEDQDFLLDGSSLSNETWEYSAGSPTGWTSLLFPGTPGFRMGHSAANDTANRQMVVFGGSTTSGFTMTNELWRMRLEGTPGWSIMTPGGTPPTGRMGSSMIYDTAHQRLVIYGGFDISLTAMDEVWILAP
jgi:hypothetical protein